MNQPNWMFPSAGKSQCSGCDTLRKRMEELQGPVLKKLQKCGCVTCHCEGNQCLGCGAKHCGNHPIGAIPNPEFERPHPLEAKVSELEGMVAGLRELCVKGKEAFTKAWDRMNWCGFTGGDIKDAIGTMVFSNYDKALADTAKIAKSHDARVRAYVWEEAEAVAWGAPNEKSFGWIMGIFRAKATKARTEADATEKGEG